jgi:Asp-tRNA(Asn)/Glu-tRNA(Gln) amidotransferase A subunit family amidase
VTDLVKQPASWMARAVREREVSAAELVEAHAARMSEFSSFWDSVNLVYGTTRNPDDPTRTAGGSSGGEAAAIAAAMSPLGIGIDLGGSIRAPAAWTGVFGIRASRDAVPYPTHDPLPLSAGAQLFGGLGPLAAPPPTSTSG